MVLCGWETEAAKKELHLQAASFVYSERWPVQIQALLLLPSTGLYVDKNI